MAADWRNAYFEQAKADYLLLLRLLEQNDIPLCQILHYVQMAAEKMAKGFLTPVGAGKYKNTHDAFVNFLQSAKNRSDLRRVCNFSSVSAFTAYINGLRPTAEAIENLSPEGEPHPNPEYPWEVNGRIITPLSYDFPGLRPSDRKMQNMLTFLESCFELIEQES